MESHCYEKAVTVLESSTAPLEHARALTDLGSVLRRLGHGGEAREHLRNGLDPAATRSGAATLLPRAN
jgi:uncharacterized protein HemY